MTALGFFKFIFHLNKISKGPKSVISSIYESLSIHCTYEFTLRFLANLIIIPQVTLTAIFYSVAVEKIWLMQ